MPSSSNYEARNTGAVMKSALGYFEALSEMGINSNLKEFGEFDFSKKDFSGQTIILANQISIPDGYSDRLEQFVTSGGKLIVDGLTAFFDDNLHNTMKTGFPFEKLLGGNISEFKLVDNLFNIKLNRYEIPAHLWRGIINNKTGKIESEESGEIYAIRNKFGNGEVLWIPSLVGLGSRIAKDYEPLSQLLSQEILLNKLPVRFGKHMPGMLMKTLKSGKSLVTVIINKTKEKQVVPLVFQDANLKPVFLFANKGGKVLPKFRQIEIMSEETLVIHWQ